MEQDWLTWPPDGFLTGPPDLGMFLYAPENLDFCAFLLVGKNCLYPVRVHGKKGDSSSKSENTPGLFLNIT